MAQLRVWLVGVGLLSAACLDLELPIERDNLPALRCVGTLECPEGLVCVLERAGEGRCATPDNPCLQMEGGDATPTPDGNACDEGRICIAGSCVTARCGDGVVTAPERCDDGDENVDAAGSCRTDCTLPRCGDRIVDPGEACDEGEHNGEAPNACRATCVAAACGDGIVDDGEECDNGGNNSDVQPGACRLRCALPRCGDGVTDPGEACDEGEGSNSDELPGSCRSHCAHAACGDGVIDPGEGCDDGEDNRNAPNACRETCVAAACGDGIVDNGEECDNGANNSDVRPGACRMQCRHAGCGDGIRDPGEGCDEGPQNSNDRSGACRTSCQPATCGDGIVDPGEVCDDRNRLSGDGCREDCAKVEVCGDGLVDEGEACDDGNANPADGCDGCQQTTWHSSLLVSGSLEGRSATDTGLALPQGVAADPLGRVYVADTGNHRVRRIDLDGTVTTIAGAGEAGFAGDEGPATSAQLDGPRSVAVDATGRVYVADTENHRVRRIDVEGKITTIAGTGIAGFAGDGGPATAAMLQWPAGVAVDAAGRVYILDTWNRRIRRVDPDGLISTIAGSGARGFTADDSPAITASFLSLDGIAVDAEGRLYIAEAWSQRVRLVGLDGVLTTIAGTGLQGHAGDGGPATEAELLFPSAVAVDPSGAVFIAEKNGHRIRRVSPEGTLSTVAGGNDPGFAGDGGAALDARLFAPGGVVVGPGGQLYVADTQNHRVRVVHMDGSIDTLGGSGSAGYAGDGAEATTLHLEQPHGVATGPDGRMYIADWGGHRVLRVEADGSVTRVAGTGTPGFSGDGGLAIEAQLDNPSSVAVDAAGRIYVGETRNRRVRIVDLEGLIRTLAGTGAVASACSSEGEPAVEVALGNPIGLAVGQEGDLYIADRVSNCIRRVDASGIHTIVAGTGIAGDAGDGGPATQAQLNQPSGVTIAPGGRIYVADTLNHRIRVIDETATMTTLSGTGILGTAHDGELAEEAQLCWPFGVTLHASGRVVFTEEGQCGPDSHRVRMIDGFGRLTTLAGTGVADFSGDGGLATMASLSGPKGVAFDPAGHLYVADSLNHRVRRIDVTGVISSVAGAVHPVGPGPGATSRLYPSAALALYGPAALLSVGAYGRVMRVAMRPAGAEVDVIAGYEAGAVASGLARFAPLLEDARGVAFDDGAHALVITEQRTGDLRILGMDPDGDGTPDDAAKWSHERVPTGLAGPAGIAYDAGSETYVIADEAGHCVRRVTREGIVVPAPVYGTCGAPGRFPGFLNAPSHVWVSAQSGAVYVSDTGNHRVLRVDAEGRADLVVGEGSVSSAGEGAPAKRFPVRAPRQLALDAHGNLYIASSDTVRLVANVDGDLDADGDDAVATLFGGGARAQFPESDAHCLGGLAVDDAGSTVYVADACQGFLVKLTRVSSR